MHLGYSLIIKQGTSPTIFIVININSWKCTLKVDFPNSSHQYFLQGWFLSVQFSCSVVSNSLQPHGLQHTRPPCPLPTPRVYSNSCPLSWWCHPTISSSVIPFSSCLLSFPASGSFPRVGTSHQVAKVLELQLQHQSFWRRKQTEQAPSWKQYLILGWTVDFELYA